MATSATTYFGNRARAVVMLSGTPAVPASYTPTTALAAQLFSVDRGFEFNIEWENHELYGTDSVFRVDEAKSQMKVTAKLRGCKFDPTVSSPVGIWDKVLRTFSPSNFNGTLEDTNVLALYDVYIYETGSAAGNPLCFQCWMGYIEGVPIPFPENDYVILDLTFHGRAGKVTNDVVPT